MPLCLLAAGAIAMIVPADSFELRWSHSVERTTWRETWRVAGATLVVIEAEVAGSGAGIDPPEGARFEGGVWRFQPAVPPLARLTLPASEYTADYALCWSGACAPLRTLVPLEASEPVTLVPCTG